MRLVDLPGADVAFNHDSSWVKVEQLTVIIGKRDRDERVESKRLYEDTWSRAEPLC